VDSTLYIFNSPGDNRQVVHKMNPDNGDTTFVMELTPEGGGSPVGTFITDKYDPYGSWVFMDIANAGREDRIDIWQLKPNIDWFVIEPSEGSIDPGGNQALTLTLSTVGLDSTLDWEGELIFSQAVGGDDTNVPITINISSSNDVVDKELHIPTEFGISAIYPNPFNSHFSFSIRLPQADIVRFHLYDITGREVWSLSERFGVGVHRQSVDLNLNSAGVYFLQAESSYGMDVQRVVMLK